MAVAVELGGARLIRGEDDGECYSEAGATVKLPDYRLVLPDDELVLVEVKNVAPGLLDTRVSVGELEALERYADLNRARLLLAHYWSQANLWTLVDASILERGDSVASLALTDALPANELVFLGDAMLATTPPLVLRLLADPQAPRGFVGKEENGERAARFTIGEVEIHAGGRPLVDQDERRIAMAMIEFGGWPGEETATFDDEESLVSVDLSYSPPDAEPGEQHRLVAPLSSLYSARFNLATLDDGGSPSRLMVPPEPGRMSRLIPRDYWARKEHRLPLWRFEQLPSVGPRADA